MDRRIKFLGFVAIAVFAFGVIAFAEPKMGEGQGLGKAGQMMKKMTPEERAQKQKEMIEKRVAQLAQKLGLTADQQVKTREILTNTAEEIQAFMKTAFEKAKELRDRDREAIKALLTPEQKTKLEEKHPDSEPPQGIPPQESAVVNK